MLRLFSKYRVLLFLGFLLFVAVFLSAESASAQETQHLQCRADFNGNGEIDIDDLQVFIHEAQIDCRIPQVPQENCSFTDISAQSSAGNAITSVCQAGVLEGCADSQFCPTQVITRAEIARVLLLVIHGDGYFPPQATGDVFDDVPASLPGASWIEQLAREGYTIGCGDNNYCPDQLVTRAESVVFLMRLRHGADYTPPQPTGGLYVDIEGHWAQAWIEAAASENILIDGCSIDSFCPDSPIDKENLAVLIYNAVLADRGQSFCRADFNGNGGIDIDDLQVLIEEAQGLCPIPPGAATPTPSPPLSGSPTPSLAPTFTPSPSPTLTPTLTPTATPTPEPQPIAVNDLSVHSVVQEDQLTFPYTSQGSDRLLLVGVSINNDDNETVDSVLFAEQNLKALPASIESDDAYSQIWYLVNPPNSGEIVVNFDQTLKRAAIVGAVTLANVNQTEPLGEFAAASDNGSSSASTDIASAQGEIIFALFTAEGIDGATPGAGQKELYGLRDADSGRVVYSAASVKDGAPASIVSYELSDSDDWALSAVAVKPSE